MAGEWKPRFPFWLHIFYLAGDLDNNRLPTRILRFNIP